MKIIRLDPDTREPAADSWTLDARHPEAVIGRGEKAAIRLDDPSVSREHARAVWQHGSLLLVDYGSINGVTLRNRRIRRAEFRSDEVVMVGAIPLQIRMEPSDRAAWRRMLVMRVSVFFLSALALLVVLHAVRDMNSEPAAQEEEAEITPLQPPVPDEATQQEYGQMLEAYRLATEAEALLMQSDHDPEAAELLIRSIRKYDFPSNRAHAMLEGIQLKHYPVAAEKIRADMARGDFEAAEADYGEIAAYYLDDDPAELRELHTEIVQNRNFGKALAMMQEGEDPDEVSEILSSLDEKYVPGLADAKARLARILEAEKWVETFADTVDGGKLDEADAMMAQEAGYADVLRGDLQDDLAAAKFRLFAYNEMLGLMAADNTYVLALRDFSIDVPFIRAALDALRGRLRGEEEEFRTRAGECAAKAGDPAETPADAAEAIASRDAAHAWSALYVLDPSPETEQPFKTHRGRWNDYLSRLERRLRAYESEGANDEIRSILEPFLPELDAGDSACTPLLLLAERIHLELPAKP
jgi:hypothetical protein